MGYAIPLAPLPWPAQDTSVEAAFMQDSWFLGLGLLLFNLAGGALLFQLKKGWSVLALSFCLIQVAIWWLLSGLLSVDDRLVQFFQRKTDAIRMLLHHPDVKVVFVTVHQDIAVGAFYHLALIWLALKVLVARTDRIEVTPII
jgi:hypothetical protein